MGLFRPVKLAGCRLLGTSPLSYSSAKTCGHQVLNKVIFLKFLSSKGRYSAKMYLQDSDLTSRYCGTLI